MYTILQPSKENVWTESLFARAGEAIGYILPQAALKYYINFYLEIM